MHVDDDMHMILLTDCTVNKMKKILIAGICGVCMFAACAFANVSGNEPVVAGAGSYTQVIH